MDLTSLLSRIISASSNEQRAQAEHAINHYASTDMEGFVLQMAKINNSEAHNQLVRQSAATLLGKFVFGKDINNHCNWDKLSADVKMQVKNYLLGTLISLSELSKKAAADAISAIAAIEIPRGEWNSLIPSLVAGVNNEDNTNKKISIMTLGFVSDKLKQVQATLDYQTESQILVAVLLGLDTKNPIQIRGESLKVMKDAIVFFNNVFSDKQYRDRVLSDVISCITQLQLTQLAIQALISFATEFYVYLPEYTSTIYPYLEQMIASQNPSYTILAIQFWNTIGTGYLERHNQRTRIKNTQTQQNVIGMVHNGLVANLMQLLFIIKKTDDDISMWDAATHCLSTIAEIVGDDLIPVFMDFVSNTISSSDWKIKQATAPAFAVLFDCPEIHQVADLFRKGFNSFYDLLFDQHPYVQEMSMSGWVKFMEKVPEVVLLNENYSKIIQTFVNKIYSKNTRISNSACLAICYMTEGLFLEEVKGCELMREPANLIKILTDLMFNNYDKSQNVNPLVISIVNILQTSEHYEIANFYLQHLITKFSQLHNSPEHFLQLQQPIFNCMIAAIHVLRHDPKISNDSLLNNLIALVVNHFTFQKDISVDGLYVLAALSTSYKYYIKPYVENFWPYIHHGLTAKVNDPNDAPTYKTTLVCLSDLSRNIRQAFANKFSIAIELILKQIKNPNVTPDCKMQQFLTMGDMISVCENYAAPYMAQVLDAVDLGFEGAIECSKNPANQDYADSLKATMIDFYHTLTTGQASTVVSQSPLLKHFPKLLRFVTLSCGPGTNPTVDYLRECVETVIDFAFTALNSKITKNEKNEIRAHTKGQQFLEVLQRLRPFENTKLQVKQLFQYVKTYYSKLG